MAKSYQGQFERSFNPMLGIPLTGGQEGLVLTITSQDCIIHWLGSVPEDSGTQLVGTTTTAILPYQEGDSICNHEASSEIINNCDSMGNNTYDEAIHTREVFMVRRPQSPLDPPEAPDVGSSDKSESNISPFIQGYDGETESQKQARERRNKLKQGRQHRARQRKEAWERYESDLAEYNRRKSEQEVGERRAANTPYDRIREALEELRATTHPDERQEQLRNFF